MIKPNKVFRHKNGAILGTFSKGADNAVSVNFSTSGGPDCDRACKHHPKTTAPGHIATRACYAVRSETRPDRAQLKAKLLRHQRMRPALVCGKALIELQTMQAKGIRIPWLRISTSGSLPQPRKARTDKLFRSQFRALVSFCVENGIPVHIPVETYSKARFYRALVGDLVCVRESARDDSRFLKATGAVSTSAGESGDSRIVRIQKAASLARARRVASGRKTIVCPAVANSFAARRNPGLRNDNAKCGSCIACADALVDIVYPLH